MTGPQSRVTDREAVLIKQWRDIEALDSDEENVSEEEFTRRKEAWFVQAFSFLQSLSHEEHCWCEHNDVMWPLLEPFYNYYRISQHNASLKILWKRLSMELGKCTQCVLQYHKAKEMYATDFVEEVVSKLLAVFQTLDEERVAAHLQEVLCKMRNKSLDTDRDCGELICVLFEVLKFPMLLDDAEIDSCFVPFLQCVDNIFELTLAGDHCYPGVYALLFHSDQTTRGIALRLATGFGKLRTAADLEPTQPLLKKHMHCLEFDLFDQQVSESAPSQIGLKARRRASFTRESLWIGLKTLLGLLEPQAFEEGVVERYPSFLSIVLNHASEATQVFWNALHCLKLLLEVLGYKLWIKTTFSPGVMRSTLIGQCFHTREEKMHKSIFDLFQPFLQSLEALQDGEYERQRRSLLYFLLQQVTHSRNFGGLMCKKARQIAFSIVLRGFKMTPASPPLECVHVWGPPLLESVKDTQLYDSVRQPAVSLLETIIIADSVVLTSLYSRNFEARHDLCDVMEVDDGESDGLTATSFGMVKNDPFMEYRMLDKLAAESETWCCAPILWVDVLGRMQPSELPISFLQAMMWAASRLSIVANVGGQFHSTDTLLDKSPEILESKEMSNSLNWEAPKGCDDGADGRLPANALKVLHHGTQLLSLLKRCSDCFLICMSKSALLEKWVWKPWFAEALILLILDANEMIKECGRSFLAWFAKEASLDNGLAFLCSSDATIASLMSGLGYAINLLMVIGLAKSSQSLQNVLFISWKLMTLEYQRVKRIIDSHNSIRSVSKSEMEGGFLKQPHYERQLGESDFDACREASQLKEKGLEKLSILIWPLISKLLQEGPIFIEDNSYLMVFARMLDLLPWVFQCFMAVLTRKPPTGGALEANSPSFFRDIRGWLDHFLSWGNISTMSINRRWKAALHTIMDKLACLHNVSEKELRDVKDWLEKGTILNDIMRGVLKSILLQSLSKLLHGDILGSGPVLNDVVDVGKCNGDDVVDTQEVIVLSDDETENSIELSNIISPVDSANLGYPFLGKPSRPTGLDPFENLSISHEPEKSNLGCSQKLVGSSFGTSHARNSVRKTTLDTFFSSLKLKTLGNGKQSSHNNFELQSPNIRSSNIFGEIMGISKSEGMQAGNHETEKTRNDANERENIKSSSAVCLKRDLEMPKLSVEVNEEDPTLLPRDTSSRESCRVKEVKNALNVNEEDQNLILKELVHDDLKDTFKSSTGTGRSVQKKSLALSSQPKRQLIQLPAPEGQSRSGARRAGVIARVAPPRLDEWYKRILSLDYFSVVGLSLDTCLDSLQAEPMLKVPTVFKSCDHYMEVFRPLVLEEFKAQLQQAHDQLNLSDRTTTGVLRLMSLEKIDDFEVGRFISDAGADGFARTCFENDLLLLSRRPLEDRVQTAHMLAKVERQERDNKSQPIKLVLKFFLRSGSARLAKVRSLLLDCSKWHITRLMSITPQLREFQALSSVEHLPLLPIILNSELNSPCSSRIHNEHTQTQSPMKKLPGKLENHLRQHYNESQIEAIKVSLKSSIIANGHELSLVQGPPGTGKTRTIVAIISAVIAVLKDSKAELSCLKERTNIGDDSKSVSHRVAVARSWQAAALAREEMENDRLREQYTGKPKSARILICAQSNAAVDELVSRLCKDGLYDMNGGYYKPFLVRVGNVKAVHPNSLPVFIDTLVEDRLQADKRDPAKGAVENPKSAIQQLRSKLDKVVDSIQVLEAQISRSSDSATCKGKQGTADDNADGEPALKAKINMLYKQRRQICGELAVMQAEEKRSFEEDRSKRQQLKCEIICQAEVVLATLNGCGGDVYSACMGSFMSKKQNRYLGDDGFFDAVVIDEAAQALEPATLIPLQLLKRSRAKCVMVGDPKQLPATVLSQLASRFSYECSMFERLQQGGHPVTMLNVQYRMHPDIRLFPSAHFYENQLEDGEIIIEGRSALFHDSEYFRPYIVFDVVEGYEKINHHTASQSLCNEAEAEVAVEIFRSLKMRYPNEIYPGRVGVITPYQQQLSLLRERFSRVLGQTCSKSIEFNTVDGFQGREVDILIFSTVRAARNSQKSSGVGFVADVRRMNVALTRARYALWVVCHCATLQTSPPWAALLANARERGVLYTVKTPYKSFFDFGVMQKTNHRVPLCDHADQAAPESCDSGNNPLLGFEETINKKTDMLGGDESEKTFCINAQRKRDSHEALSAEYRNGGKLASNKVLGRNQSRQYDKENCLRSHGNETGNERSGVAVNQEETNQRVSDQNTVGNSDTFVDNLKQQNANSYGLHCASWQSSGSDSLNVADLDHKQFDHVNARIVIQKNQKVENSEALDNSNILEAVLMKHKVEEEFDAHMHNRSPKRQKSSNELNRSTLAKSSVRSHFKGVQHTAQIEMQKSRMQHSSKKPVKGTSSEQGGLSSHQVKVNDTVLTPAHVVPFDDAALRKEWERFEQIVAATKVFYPLQQQTNHGSE